MNKVKFLFVLFAIDNSVCSTYASLYAEWLLLISKLVRIVIS